MTLLDTPTESGYLLLPKTHPNYGISYNASGDRVQQCVPQFVDFYPGEYTDHQRVYMDGFCDASTGEVDSPMGHWYRVETFLVRTDHLGFKATYKFASIPDAIVAFDHIDNQYGNWISESVIHTTCHWCGLDIEGNYETGDWRDRGGNALCNRATLARPGHEPERNA